MILKLFMTLLSLLLSAVSLDTTGSISLERFFLIARPYCMYLYNN